MREGETSLPDQLMRSALGGGRETKKGSETLSEEGQCEREREKPGYNTVFIGEAKHGYMGVVYTYTAHSEGQVMADVYTIYSLPSRINPTSLLNPFAGEIKFVLHSP